MNFEINADHLKTITVEVKSSLIQYLSYSYGDYSLSVKYKYGKHKGQVRTYQEVSPAQFFELLGADSVGKALLKLIQKLKSVREYS